MPREMVIVTPENAEIRVPLAGMFTRAWAFVKDTIRQIIGLIIIQITLLIIASQISRHNSRFAYDLFQGFNLIVTFVWVFGYHTYYEIFHNGQTPGKMAMNIRVVGANGQKIGFFSSVLRNFLRIADFLPALFFSGGVSSLVSERHQRLGDLFAATVVIRGDSDE